MTETRTLHRKLAQVMYEAERIPKRGRAPQVMGGFEFVQVGDAADYIRKALAEKVVSMMPSQVEVVGETEHETAKGGTMTTLELRVTWTLTDGESGETAVIQSFGAGADTGDKYSGKAMTNAMKYALLAGFLLSTGDDTELSDTSDRRTSQPLGPGERPDAGGAVEELLGIESAQGTVKLGSSEAYKLDPRETTEGMAFGFRLEMAGDKAIPQVMVIGEAAIAALLATQNEPKVLLNHNVRVKGKLFAVRAPGRRTFTRLKATEIATQEWSYPTSELPSAGDAVPSPAPDDASASDSGGASSPAASATPSSGVKAAAPPDSDEGASDVPAQTPEVTQGVDETAEGAPTAAEAGARASAVCGNKGSMDTVCTLAKGHDGKHRELATDGRVLASWE